MWRHRVLECWGAATRLPPSHLPLSKKGAAFWEQSAKLRQEEKALVDATQTTVTSSDHQKQNEDTA